MIDQTNLSPMMQQYFAIKNQHKEHILFFRLGDFYEMFYDDAITASKELELTLTGRDCGQEERAPMCGVPYHSCEAYIARLIKKGYKVAICEQVENPATAKGVVKREVIRVVTPGTLIESNLLEEGEHNYICCLMKQDFNYGVVFCDISTGEVHLTELHCEQKDNNKLKNELGRFYPSEIIFNSEFLHEKDIAEFIKTKLTCSADLLDDNNFEYNYCVNRILAQFNKPALEDLGLVDKPLAVAALGALLSYLGETQKVGMERIQSLSYYSERQFMNLDLVARRNLELTETLRNREKRGSLLWVLDKTKTAMGKRLIRTWLEQPLMNVAAITKRLAAVTELTEQTILRAGLIESLGNVYDLERLMTKIVYGNAQPRELKSLEATIARLPEIKENLKSMTSQNLSEIYRQIDELRDVKQLIAEAICENPPVAVKDGGVIQEGFHQELDELRNIVHNTKSVMAAVEAKEKETTGIKNLKIGYNRVFGYYIEVTKSYQDLVPQHYIRKQTLANCERYITQELKDLEEKIMTAHEQILTIEAELFEQVRQQVAAQLHRIQTTANAVASLDVYCSFAQVAVTNHYCCPTVNLSDRIFIKDGRHPVVETLLGGMPFVSNDTKLDNKNEQIAIITGPNMAGKSTYMRQVALITLMAQIGSFVPAKEATIGVVDGIYTRVGASDDLSAGQSTFMVEMSEVSYILKNATAQSLLILDEIGRGTSTYDGMSIARAVIEYIADKKQLGAKTLFATHYHELTELEEQIPAVKNYNIAVKKRGDDIIFLRRIISGGADDSYGIEVSKLAGIPDRVIKRAHQILKELESGQQTSLGPTGRHKKIDAAQEEQITFGIMKQSAVSERLKNLDVNTLTPLEALNLIYELKQLVQ